MTSSYAFINTTPEVESTWTVIKQSISSPVDRLENLVALLRGNFGQLELKTLSAQLCFVTLRDLRDLKAQSTSYTEPTNKRVEFDKKVNELFDLIDLEVGYCDKQIQFSAREMDLPTDNQYNRWRLSRVQLFATQALAYSKEWSTKQSQLYKKRLLALQTITDVLVRFDNAQKTFLKSLEEETNPVKTQKKTLTKKPATCKTTTCKKSGCPPMEHRNAPYPPDLFKGQSTPLKPD